MPMEDAETDDACTQLPDGGRHAHGADGGPEHTLWIAALHGAAVRRWLDIDPPAVAEARASVRMIELLGRDFHRPE